MISQNIPCVAPSVSVPEKSLRKTFRNKVSENVLTCQWLLRTTVRKGTLFRDEWTTEYMRSSLTGGGM
jgi:hypothetical protein